MRTFNIMGNIHPEMPNEPKMIHLSQIECDTANFFAENQGAEAKRIDALAEEIMETGFRSVIEVYPDKDKYKIIAGETRFRALQKAYETTNRPEFAYIPCFINEADTDIARRRRLIMDNMLQRDLTPAQKLQAIEELQKSYKEEKKSGHKLPGRIQYLIAQNIGMKKSQVGTYQKIIKNGSNELKENIQNETISVEAAAKLSSLPHDDQKEYLQNNGTSNQNVEQFIAEKKKQSQQSVDQEEQTNIYEYLDDDQEHPFQPSISSNDQEVLHDICDQFDNSIILDIKHIRTRLRAMENPKISTEIEIMLEEIQDLADRLHSYM